MSQKASPQPSVTSTNNTDSSRPRSNSVLKSLSHLNSSTSNQSLVQQQQQQQQLQQQKQNFRRSLSVSEGLHVKLPSLHHSDTEPFPYSPQQPSTPSVNSISSANPICSESNWANKYDDFDIGKPIGYGSSAVVYEAMYKPLKKRVAIKMIDLDMFERNQIDELRRETALMALSKHPNVLRVYGSFVNGSKLYIVTPYLAAGSCLDIMKTSFPNGIDEVSIATILRQALEGLVYLHKNGHIHRDVKAGNLLMDQYGTVLLADFGVSSSLAENGDVRKTFVGTPCWMAPEVMEQAGYDYKADIWSFGITSLELATGHAPFAKYPPMKVLMMTLSNAPPTLDRENGAHKYSRAFKDMIDSCLQKDPSKRPSADKLLLHPFFKQAKKREYLVKSILCHVPPLDQRPHKKVPQKHISFEITEQWDFDTQSDDETNGKAQDVAASTGTSTPTSSAPSPDHQVEEQHIQLQQPQPQQPSEQAQQLPPIKKHISFGDAIIKRDTASNNTSNTSPPPEHDSSHNNSEQPNPPPLKKHISFGDAVIKDTPLRPLMSPVTESPSPIMSSSAASSTPQSMEQLFTPVSTPALGNTTATPSTAATAPPIPPTTTAAGTAMTPSSSKKSRFVIEDNSTIHSTHTVTSTAPSEASVTGEQQQPQQSHSSITAGPGSSSNNVAVGLGISTSPSSTVNQANSSTAATSTGTLHEGEFKKGRFSVNQAPTRTATLPATEEAEKQHNQPSSANANHTITELKSMPMSRAASQDSFQSSDREQKSGVSIETGGKSERKSRFEVQHSNSNNLSNPPAANTADSAVTSTPALQTYPLTRENSTASIALSRDGSKVSRFSIEKESTAGGHESAAAAATNTASSAAASHHQHHPSTSSTGSYHQQPSNPASTTTMNAASNTITNAMTAPAAGIPCVTSPECRKKGRFELTGGTSTATLSDSTSTINRQQQLQQQLLDKEHTLQYDSPQSTVTPSPCISPSNSVSRGQAHRVLDTSLPHTVFSHMENLLKQTEMQKNLLQDLLSCMPNIYHPHNLTNNNNINNTSSYSQPSSTTSSTATSVTATAANNGMTRSRTISDSKRPNLLFHEDVYPPLRSSNLVPTTMTSTTNLNGSSNNVLAMDMSQTLEHLQHLLLSSNKEKEKLIRENEALKKEVERLRKTQNQQQQQNNEQS